MTKRPQRAGSRTQKTTPKKGAPIEIPVPKRKQFEEMLRRAALRRTSSSK